MIKTKLTDLTETTISTISTLSTTSSNSTDSIDSTTPAVLDIRSNIGSNIKINYDYTDEYDLSNYDNTNITIVNDMYYRTKIDSFEPIIEKIKKRTLLKVNYKYMNDHKMSIKLSDQVLFYNSGNSWKIIPLIWALTYPIIYDTYYYGNTHHDVSIIVCPITLTTVMLKGIFTLNTYDGLTMILQEKDTNYIIPINSGKKIDNKYVIETNKRSEIQISTLRNALVMAPDIMYMVINKNLKIDTIIDMSYYSDDKDIYGKTLTYYIHPKTLCYVIQKKKFGSQIEKTYVLLGKDADKHNITGYDIRKSGIIDYLMINNEKLIRDEAYILPILWCTAQVIYEKSKVLYIKSH